MSNSNPFIDESRRYVLAPASVVSLQRAALLGVPLAMDDRCFVYALGLQIFKYIPETQEIEFVDKDQRRADLRGNRLVRISLAQLKAIVEMYELLRRGKENGPPPEMLARPNGSGRGA